MGLNEGRICGGSCSETEVSENIPKSLKIGSPPKRKRVKLLKNILRYWREKMDDAIRMMESKMKPESVERSRVLAEQEILAIRLGQLREKLGETYHTACVPPRPF